MKLVFSLVVLTCAVFEARGYPYPVFTSTGNVDTWTHGDASRGGMVLSRSYNPYANQRAVRAGSSTYSLWQPESEATRRQSIQNYQADRRRQALLEVNDTPPQENAVYYPQAPESPAVVPVEATEFIVPVEQAEIVPTTVKATIHELTEPEIEEQGGPGQQSKKAVQKTKQVKRPVDEEDDDEEDYPANPKFLSGAFFPMFFGRGGGGPTAVANAFSTGKGGAAASHAIAYGNMRPEERSQH